MALHGLDPKMIAGELKAVPDLPVITVAEDTKILSVTAKCWRAASESDTGERRLVALGTITESDCSCKAP